VHDLVIRNGTVVDGTGAPARVADVAVRGDRIVDVGADVGPAHRVVHADGLHVTPGFVDIHTHFDGQATWDPLLAPSSQHGVTSVVMGNCGVGFAPATPGDAAHDWLIGLLEGVEDIPGTALAEGLAWDWETLPQYLDALEARRHVLDVATQVAHAPLRVYVMGERGADPNEHPDADELAAMARHVRVGIEAGALGFTTSRTYVHRTRDGAPLGTRFSHADELHALVGAMAETGRGVVQMISDAYQSPDEHFAREEMVLMASIARASGRPLSMTVQQPEHVPDRWRTMRDWVAANVRDGVPMRMQVAPRPIGVLVGLTASVNPLMVCPSYQAIAGRPLAEIVGALDDPALRTRLVVEHREVLGRLEGLAAELLGGFHKLFAMDDPVSYEPAADRSVAARAAAAGVEPVELLCDLLGQHDGTQLLYLPLFNFARGNLDDVREMLLDPHAIIGLSDAGAHCGAISDASFPTTALALWGRDRADAIGVEAMVHHLTQRTAAHVGWRDRGVLAAGMLADLNVIDLGALAAHPPRIVHDLPAGGRRLVQDATGYRHTFKRGVETFVDGEHTGALPGRLVRGPQVA
jgi:N-acyl-D-aspartate/D-glutamate deacylase